MFGLGTPEILMIAVVALVLFGPAKLPSLAKAMGGAWREFQHGLKGEDEPVPPVRLQQTVDLEPDHAPVAVAAAAAPPDTTMQPTT